MNPAPLATSLGALPLLYASVLAREQDLGELYYAREKQVLKTRPRGLEPGTSRLQTQALNHCARLIVLDRTGGGTLGMLYARG